MLTWVGAKNHVLYEVQDPSCEGVILRGGEGATRWKVQGLCSVSCAKTAEPIGMLFQTWTRVGTGNLILDKVQMTPWEGALLWCLAD